MFGIQSSAYKVALWIASLPYSFFLIRFVERVEAHRSPLLSETVGMTLIMWLILCWVAQRKCHTLRTRPRRQGQRGWQVAAAILGQLALLLAYFLQAPFNAIGLAISLLIANVLEMRMTHACLRERRAIRW